jgi:hypothetical protein
MNDDEKKKKAAMICKLLKRLKLAMDVLDADMEYASKQWQQDQSSQFWARTSIRCFCASVEGMLSLLKSITLETANYFNVTLNEKEKELVAERRKITKDGVIKEIPSYSPFSERVKETFKLFLKAHAVEISIDYNDSGFIDLCSAFELRNRLMHPRGVFDLAVDEKSMQSAIRGQRWFSRVIEVVLEKCDKQTPFSEHNAKA